MKAREPIRLRYARNVLRRAKEKFRDAWMSYHKHDRMCPCCNLWYSETESWDNVMNSADDADTWHEVIICNNCGTKAYWVCDFTHFVYDYEYPEKKVKV